MKVKFISQWSKFVPAIITYAEKNSRKNVSSLVSLVDAAGEYSDPIYAADPEPIALVDAPW